MLISSVILFAFKNWKIASRYGFASGVSWPLCLLSLSSYFSLTFTETHKKRIIYCDDDKCIVRKRALFCAFLNEDSSPKTTKRPGDETAWGRKGRGRNG